MNLPTKRSAGRRIGLYAVSVGCLVSCLFAPATRNVAREDINTALRVCGFRFQVERFPSPDAYAAAHPADDAVQAALAMSGDSRQGESLFRAYVKRLEPLLDRYPRSAVIRAAILRYSADKKGLSSDERSATERAAREGEALEPDNAVYPAMCWALIPGRTDSKQALLRAARKTRWDEHTREEIEGRWRLKEAGSHHHSGVDRLILGSATLFPQYAALRQSAKGAAAEAARLEATGHTTGGLAIRHALMRVGSLMRTQSTTLIGNVVGVSIDAMAAKDPGGRTVTRAAFTDAQRAKELAAYETYLNGIGRPDEAAFARREFKAGQEVRALLHDETNRAIELWDQQGYLRVRMLAFVLLLGAAFTLMSARVAALMARAGCAGDGRQLNKPAVAAVVLVGGVLIVGIALRMALSNSQSLSLIYSLDPSEPVPSPLVYWPVGLFALLAVPILLKALFLATAVVKRRPVIATVVNGFQRYAGPLAAVLAIGYCGMLLDVARLDASIATAVTAQFQNEGRYYAHLAGVPWPD